MELKELIKRKIELFRDNNYMQFTSDELKDLRPDAIEYLISQFHGYGLMKLPPSEIEFFEWMKRTDRAVWNDLWEDAEDQYVVSINLLRQVSDAGFPICDLISQPNYWFCDRHIKPKGLEAMPGILAKLETNQQLTADEQFLLDIFGAPQDIWHFCYRNRFEVKQMKTVIEDMVYQGWIVHLTDREDLLRYIDL
jgi:hypothetical protein